MVGPICRSSYFDFCAVSQVTGRGPASLRAEHEIEPLRRSLQALLTKSHDAGLRETLSRLRSSVLAGMSAQSVDQLLERCLPPPSPPTVGWRDAADHDTMAQSAGGGGIGIDAQALRDAQQEGRAATIELLLAHHTRCRAKRMHHTAAAAAVAARRSDGVAASSGRGVTGGGSRSGGSARGGSPGGKKTSSLTRGAGSYLGTEWR
jgi:hypothetical protein